VKVTDENATLCKTLQITVRTLPNLKVDPSQNCKNILSVCADTANAIGLKLSAEREERKMTWIRAPPKGHKKTDSGRRRASLILPLALFLGFLHDGNGAASLRNRLQKRLQYESSSSRIRTFAMQTRR